MADAAAIGCARPAGGPGGRNVSETIRQVQAFQLVRESKGAQATPSGWEPGKKTLSPGGDPVGKVWQEWKTEMAFTA